MQEADLKWFERSLLIFAAVALGITGLFFLARHELATASYRLRDFSKYRSDFQTIARIARERYQEAKETYGDELKQIVIHQSGDEWEVNVSLRSDSGSQDSDLVLTENEKKAYRSVRKAIHTIHSDNSASFLGVRVTDNCVIFMTDLPTYLCYGYRPYRSQNSRTQAVDVLALHWYQVCFP